MEINESSADAAVESVEVPQNQELTTEPQDKTVSVSVRRRRSTGQSRKKSTQDSQSESVASMPTPVEEQDKAPSEDLPPSGGSTTTPAKTQQPRKKRPSKKNIQQESVPANDAETVSEPNLLPPSPQQSVSLLEDSEPVLLIQSLPEPVLLDSTPEVVLLESSSEEPGLPPESVATGTEQKRTSRRRRTSRKKTGDSVPKEETTDISAIIVEPFVETVAPEEPGQHEKGGVVEEPPVVSTRQSKLTVPRPSLRSRRQSRKVVEDVDESVKTGARLVTRRGIVELQINEDIRSPIFFFGNQSGVKEVRRVVSEIQRAAKAGIHLHSTLVELPCPLPTDGTVLETLDTRLQVVLDADPQSLLMPRLVFMPAPGWRKQYPNEVMHYADGSTDDPSIASERYWNEAEKALEVVIEHVNRTGYGDRVIGYHLERGEWFHPADSGYDRSYANREAFREWLQIKYKNSEAALRAAWYDGQVQFYTAEIPPRYEPAKPEITFLEPRRQRRWIDFLEFTSEATANRLIALSKIVKQATDNRALVSVCYGYTLEWSHTFSGHLALARLFAAPTIDIVAGPPSYRDRLPGGSGSYPSPADSAAVHGKLWLSEDDTKTHLAPSGDGHDDFNPRVDNRTQTEQVHLRAIGRAMAHQTGIAWMDVWGDGWLDAVDIWERISVFNNRMREYQKMRHSWSPQVAILISEQSLLHIQRGDNFITRLLQEQREIIERSGASVGFYLQGDIKSRLFPTDAKLYIFVDPYRMPYEHRAAIKEKLQTDGKTLVWMHALGVCDERGAQEEGCYDTTGITLRQQAWNSELGTRFLEVNHPILESLQNKTLGVKERMNPSFYVDDENPQVTMLGEYVQSGLPSFAVREMENWRSVFCGEPTLSPELFRNLCKYAGVHLFTNGVDEYVFAGDGWLTLHAIKDGYRVISLPIPSALYDLGEMRLLSEEIKDYRTFIRGKTTRSLYFGTLDDMFKMGFPGVEKLRGRKRKVADKPAPDSPVMPIVLEPMEPESETVELEAAPGDLSVNEEETDGEAEGTDGDSDEANLTAAQQIAKKRRRRRGGRGRGYKPKTEGGAEPA